MKKSHIIIKNIVLQALTLALLMVLLRLKAGELISDFYCVVLLIVTVTAAIMVYFYSFPARKLRLFNLVSGVLSSAVLIGLYLLFSDLFAEKWPCGDIGFVFGGILYTLCAATCFIIDGIKILGRTSAVKKVFKGLWK